MPAQDIKQMGDREVIGFHRHLPPFRATRMDWRSFPALVRRRGLPVLSVAHPSERGGGLVRGRGVGVAHR